MLINRSTVVESLQKAIRVKLNCSSLTSIQYNLAADRAPLCSLRGKVEGRIGAKLDFAMTNENSAWSLAKERMNSTDSCAYSDASAKTCRFPCRLAAYSEVSRDP